MLLKYVVLFSNQLHVANQRYVTEKCDACLQAGPRLPVISGIPQ